MAAISRGGSGRMYSWWWDSHISPKNSRWLQENLTDMDSKVKSMIKLIEEDADSFARRAEMYYKKRPELMKLVEEFYRAYRALAERYDHATGVIRQAQKTMVEAFPNQAPYILGDESVGGSAPGDPSAPDMSTPIRSFLDTDDFLKDGMGLPFLDLGDPKRNGTLTEESDSTVSRKGLKQPGDPSRLKDYAKFAEGRARKGLKFEEPLGKERSVESNETHKNHSHNFASQKTDDSHEILLLKKALAEVKAQKDAGLIQYQESLVKLSFLESEVNRAQENSRGLSEQAAQAENEVQALKEALVKLETEKEASLQQYRDYLNQISDMEKSNSRLQEETDQLMQRATKAETEAHSLQEEIGKLVAEKDITLNQYMGSLEMISNLQNKLQSCENDAKNLKERAEKAENEVETLKQDISKLIEEKDAAVLKYEKCMITISGLEHELSSTREEAQRLNVEIDNRDTSLKNAEERCVELEKTNQTLHSEVESLMRKMGGQSQDLTEKQKELGRLWTCIQEERLRFVEAETAFQTLQHLHAQAQDELRKLTSELQNKIQSLNNIETHNKSLLEQIITANEENKSLNALNLSSSLTIQQLGNEVSDLKETKGKLEEEVEIRVDQRNALQQEIYCLKEELNVLNKQHSSIMEQVLVVGLSPEHFGSSVKELQDENTSFKETCLREKNEKVALLEKVLVLDQLLEKNSVLEMSLADLNTELEALREKIQALEESYKSLSDEKSSLMDEKASLTAELKTTNKNLQKISEDNAILENSLSDVHDELQGLTTKSTNLEDSFNLLVNQNAIIVGDRDSLTSELVSTQVRLENLEKIYSELEKKHAALKDEKEASLCKIEELNTSLDVEKKERAMFEQVNKLQLSKMENEMTLLLEELEHTKEEYDKEWKNAFESQTEIYMLRKCAQDLEEKNVNMLNKNHRLSETSETLAGLFAGLKQDYLNQEIEMKAVSKQASTLRMGIFDFFKAIDIDSDHEFVDRCEDHHLSSVLSKLGSTQTSIHRKEEEKFLLSNELSVLVIMLQQLKIDAENLAVEKNVIDREFSIRGNQLAMLQNENLMLDKTKEEMIAKIIERDQEKEESRIQMLDLQKKLLDLQRENNQGLEERGSMKDELLLTEEKIHTLEEENHVFCMEVFSLEILSVFLKNSVDEKSKELKALNEDLHELDRDNLAIKQRLNLTERMLNDMLIQKGFELQQIREEHENTKLQAEVSHSSERKLLVKDINMWQEQATKLFDEMQVSNLYNILFEQKLWELADECQRLVGENTSKESSINLLNEKVGALTSQNEKTNAQLAAYGPVITSLKQSISSLEKRSTMEVVKDVGIENQMHERSIVSNEDSSDPLSDLQDLQKKIETIENAIVERGKLISQESLNVHSELESAMKQIAELKSDSNLRRRRPMSEMSELESALLTKDIMLDQVSESSPYGSSKREADNNNDNSQIHESWETIDKDSSIDLKMSNNPNKEISPLNSKQSSFKRTRSLKKQQSSNRFGSDFMIEKELGVDKLEISKRFVVIEPPHEGQKKKVLERLNSDIQKLANLQITVEDLKRKLKIIGMSKKGKPMEECEILKEQLEEADVSILKLFDQNSKLMKNIDCTPPNSSMDAADESGSAKERRNSEQARRMSEKIGRIQMEVQKIQFVLLKLDIENDTKGKSKVSEARRRVVLKDYLYGGGVKSAYNKKKAAFCSCIRPQTAGD